MNTSTGTPSSPSVSGANLKHDREFDALLGGALRDPDGHGREAVLLELNAVRADDIEHTFGARAAAALRQTLIAAMVEVLGESTPLCHAGHCDMVALLTGTSCEAAARLGHRLRERIEGTLFHWHEHPFRLGTHVAVLELGPDPASAGAWRELGREVSRCARDMGGARVQVLTYDDHARARLSGASDWRDHLTEIVA